MESKKEIFSFEELFSYEYWNELGYLPGLGRNFPHPEKSHLYKGPFNDPFKPMCKRAWNRDDGKGFSIWRNNIGKEGI